ncbi:MAG: 3-carboxy-cis,cis-muconate cycloisomerase [Solirubrobacteraceae bacterium]|nr:3-carboxy-cis,cis-muconate cycloisomerase [Solirubrobacteraceae bacterium]
MRPPSSPSDGLFGAITARGGAAAAVADEAWLQALLDAEAALARALAATGWIADGQADAIAAACRAEGFDAGAIGAAAVETGNPAAALARALRERVGEDVAAHVHRGATSQDILDSAAMLVARRALEPLLDDLSAAAEAAATLARAHRDTPMAGRTLLQQAVPITFGLKAAGWLAALADARDGLARVRDTRLAAQLGGAAGTLSAFGGDGPDVLAAFARELGLAEPVLAWHTLRGRIGELAGSLGVVAGAIGKVARDVTLLAQTEVGEVAERAGGGSSAMPHKRNPVAAVAALGCAAQAPGLVATLLAAQVQEHERAAGAWHAEWRPLSALLAATGSAVAWLRACLEGLEVDSARMRANLDATGGRLGAEAVVDALAPALGRSPSHDLVACIARETDDFPAALAADPEVGARLDRPQIDALLDPARRLGAAAAFVDRALEAHG